jgi:hypothetical protein
MLPEPGLEQAHVAEMRVLPEHRPIFRGCRRALVNPIQDTLRTIR